MKKNTRMNEKNLKTITVVLLLLAFLLAEGAVASYITEKTGLNLNTGDRLAAYVAETAAVLQEQAPVLDKNYVVEKNATSGPKPNASCFGSTTDPAEVEDIVAQAEYLLDGQELSWNSDIEIKPGSEIRYYLDDTMLAIVWQEVRNHSVVTLAEVKLADASQMIRRVSENKAGGHNWETPTDMADKANAVVAISGDFYLFRGIGISVYQGEIYRNDPTYLDHCFVDYSGNMHLLKRGEIAKSEVAQYIKDNDISYSLAFGPALVRDGEKQKVTQYSLGEIWDPYTRASIGQVDDLHYILMTIHSELYYYNSGVISDSIEIMYEKNCKNAYALDGGRTGSLVFNGEIINVVNYGGERTMSDIIAFVSAVPEDEQ